MGASEFRRRMRELELPAARRPDAAGIPRDVDGRAAEGVRWVRWQAPRDEGHPVAGVEPDPAVLAFRVPPKSEAAVNAPATRRVNHGRGHRYLLDGDQADGVTSVVGDGIPKRALIDWAARTTAGYAVDHWDELAAESPSARLRTLEKARFASVREAGVRGTDVHALAQRLAGGEEVDVPEPLTGHVDAYLAFAEQWQPREILVEAVVANRRWRYMGTLDLVAQLNDGQTWLLDWKTSASGIWPEAALQLAAYRNAEFYIDADGAEQPLPQVDACGCVWLRADGYDLIPVQADADTYRLFLYAQQIAQFTRAPREHYVLEALTAAAEVTT